MEFVSCFDRKGLSSEEAEQFSRDSLVSGMEVYWPGEYLPGMDIGRTYTEAIRVSEDIAIGEGGAVGFPSIQ